MSRPFDFQDTIARNTKPLMSTIEDSSTSFYTAIIQDIYPTNNVAMIQSSEGRPYGFFVGNLMASLMGLSQTSFPEIGSTVLVLRSATENTDTDFIIGTIPVSNMSADWQRGSNGIGVTNDAYAGVKGLSRYDRAKNVRSSANGSAPVDIVEGEQVIQNAYGVTLGLLSTLATLKGSDLSKIECFVIDDLVRILSMQFQHVSAFGEYKILNNNGALNVMFKGAMNEYETWGLDEPKNKDLKTYGNNQMNLSIDSPDKVFMIDGKWRFQQYLGKLGSFVHQFISDPVAMIDPTKQEGDKFVAGRGRMVTNIDGSFLLQSVGDIVLEKTVAIPVPTMKVLPEEIKFVEGKLDAYQPWNPGNNLFEASYQLRDYTKWFSNYYSLAGFFSTEKGQVVVPSEKDVSDPSSNCGDQNIVEDKNTKAYVTRYATIRIFKDGSIVVLDGYNACVHLTNGNVNIDAPVDVNITAGNNINLIAKNITGLAKDELDLTALRRGILLKSKAWLEAYCDKGPLLLQSNMPTTKPEFKIEGENGEEDDKEAAQRWEDAEGSGIILKTNFSNILSSATYASTLVKGFGYVNTSRTSIFTPIYFDIKDAIAIAPGEMDIGCSLVKMNNLYTNSISNATAGIVSLTAQPGLTQTHDIGTNTPEASKMYNEAKSFLKSSTNEFAEKAVESNVSQNSKFKYIPTTDNLLPKYEELYQSISQNLIIQTTKEEYKNAYNTVSFPDSDFGNKDINYPMYPPRTQVFKKYIPKLTLGLIPERCDKTELKPMDIKGDFQSTNPIFAFKKSAKVKEG